MASKYNKDQPATNYGTKYKLIRTEGRDRYDDAIRERGNRNRTNTANFRRNFNHKHGHGQRRYSSFKYLDNLLKLNEEEFVLQIAGNIRGLEDFLNESDLSDDMYVLIIRILKKICDSRFTESQHILLQTVLKGKFVKQFQKYLGSLPMHDEEQKRQNQLFWQNTSAFWTILIEVSRKALGMLPNYTFNILSTLASSLRICILTFEQYQNQCISDEIKKGLDELVRALEATRLRFEGETASENEKQHKIENEEPPNDFRLISVYPDASEILSECNFLRPNVIDGPYRDVDHYLDVQFRLRREDFINPLRSGVHSIQSGSKMRHENVRVYKRVRFLYPETINEYYCVRMKFKFSEKKLYFNYENSKKFMFGTLLCFTPDNFATLKFARVVKRDIKDLQKGELIVGFDEHKPDLRFDCDYLMVECSVYFEPYFHVLTALKNIYESDFAMKNYIVNVRPVDTIPKYLDRPMLLEVDENLCDMEDLIKTTANLFEFNDSQVIAFKAALTKEFAIIQGPPGTGKTFLGLKIVRTLLQNRHLWWSSSPMLVICFTNHALDQFLEGVLDMTRNIARIGGQSKSDRLKYYNLYDLRKNVNGKRSSQSWFGVKQQLKILSSLNDRVKMIEQCQKIVPFHHLSRVLPRDFGGYFHRNECESYQQWLLGPYYIQYSPKDDINDEDINIAAGLHGDNNPENIDAHYHPWKNENYRSLVEETITRMNLENRISMYSLNGITSIIRRYKYKVTPIVERGASSIATNSQVLKGTPPLNTPPRFINTWINFIAKLEELHEYLKRRLNEVKNAMRNQQIRTDIDDKDLTALSFDQRWALYTSWLNTYKLFLQEQVAEATEKFTGLFKQYEEVQHLGDTQILRQKYVVGMTTTSAARLKTVLEGLHSPIVIVEEAAEVLEAHIITALTKHCQHLILIGGHKQLKPSSADYKITKDYNLGISLFERMVRNGIECHTLKVQHRMRPEISRLICPIIYSDLKDHETVFNRPLITGIDNCVQFIDHTNPEDDCGDNPTKKNLHEVQFALALARHLILNGYKSEQVTILAAYLGQFFAMLRERTNFGTTIKNVRIVALDNYQGEESDIIILSLVRSNDEKKIGFLATENRVCVALSRAKIGFYMIGNMGLLSSVSKLWCGIKEILESQNALGPDLTLRCVIHRDITTLVRKSEDFLRVPEGGCSRICGARLICDHLCRSVCHIQNRDHKDYQCLERCNKKLCDQDEKHICPKLCYEECGPCTYEVVRKLHCEHEVGLACSVDIDTHNCCVLVKTKLPCGHNANKPCHRSVDTFACPWPCDVKVEPCGHSCVKSCHIRNDPDHIEYKCRKGCARPRKGCSVESESAQHNCPNLCYQECSPCDIPMRKRRNKCEHINTVACRENVDSVKCKKPCTRRLTCGHECKKTCDEACDVSSCTIKVLKTLEVCKHELFAPCNGEPNRRLCNKQCLLKLSCGHYCTRRCNQVCTPQCKILVDCQVEAACGHTIVSMKCHDFTSGLKFNDRKLLANCTYPCKVRLKCDHECLGTCGKCFQGRFHEKCAQKCGVPLVCNHECTFPCRQACRPCDKPCIQRCVHSVCRKKCGQICTPCKEPCKRRCAHRKCSKYCSSFCDVPPCDKPCPKSLECGHPCIGFCGDDPCPPKCLICDREELLETDILFGHENENSRFIFLLDCKHVIESEGMEKWLQMSDDSSEVGVKVCPKCKTPIVRTLRYCDCVKRATIDMNRVKLKVIGSSKEIDGLRRNVVRKIGMLHEKLESPIWKVYIEELKMRFAPVRKERRRYMDKIQLAAFTSKLEVLDQIAETCKNLEGLKFHEQFQQEIYDVLTRDIDFITVQEIEDVMRELPRLLRAIQYARITSPSSFAYWLTTNSEVKKLNEDIQTDLYRLGSYSDDENIKSCLEKLKEIVKSPQLLNDVERKQIVAAMGMARGHWFKCPNGHVYAIGNCGGAVQVSKCNECGAIIGGTSYSLARNNTLASEMDGAAHAAYPAMRIGI